MTDRNGTIGLSALAGAALLAFVPMAVNDPYMTPKLVALALAAGVMLARSSARTSSLWPAVAVGAAAWLLAAALGRDWSYSAVGAYLAPFDGMTAVIVYAGVLFAAARASESAEDAADAVCWAALPLLAYCLVQACILDADPLLPHALPTYGRIIGTMGSPVYLGAVLALVVPCAASAILRGRLSGAVALGMCLPAIWATQTRGAMLAAGAGLAVLLPGKSRWAALAAGVAMLASPRLAASVSDSGRLETWRTAWDMFASAPLFGVGPGCFAMAFRQFLTAGFVQAHGNSYIIQAHAHNQVLHVLATTGLFGLAGWLAVAGGAVRAAWGRPLPMAVLAAYAVAAMFNPVPHSATALLAIVLGAATSVPVRAEARAWGLSAACAAVLLVTVSIMVGDRYLARGLRAEPWARAELFGLAAKFNPWETSFAARNIDAVMAISGEVSREDRAQLVDAALGYSRRLVARHPMDAYAHEILGRSLVVSDLASGRSGDNAAQAERHYRIASTLAPTFEPIMMRRAALARALGDGPGERAARAELQKVSRLVRGGG